jgi:hypothetical protein
MSKRAKKFKVGDEVWVKATFVDGTDEFPQVMVRGYCFVDARQHDGGLDIITVSPSSRVMKLPPVRATPEARPKVAKKQHPTKGAKKK